MWLTEDNKTRRKDRGSYRDMIQTIKRKGGGGHHKGREGRGDLGVTVGPGAGVRQEARGAWWQGPGLGGVALTGPRGPGAAGPYGEQ